MCVLVHVRACECVCVCARVQACFLLLEGLVRYQVPMLWEIVLTAQVSHLCATAATSIWALPFAVHAVAFSQRI